ncbi:amidohydrolase family protein [Wenzhouxiangella sediminis]|uniref:Amidohydrolase n=1 Tax=Wenzhouxiangella sediminis TaxID=1792836 RepID=A0A3E1K621_9GAMM|nr:amidohydrolase family protein [Wenzhouxiangella sediminis]RFF29483.1 amidohydrolase [Wenzhouxiangella sediminis]
MKTMKKTLTVLALLAAAGPALAQDIAVRAGKLYTAPGEMIEDGVVVIEDGKIAAVGPADSTDIPEGMLVLDAAVATPGLIDARSTVGLSGYLNQPHDQDQLERSAAIQPELRAIDAYNPLEKLVSWQREHGVTTLHTGHGPGEVISGQMLIAKSTGDTVDEAVVRPYSALAATLGEGATRHERSSPGNRSKAVAMLRGKLIAAQEYRDKLESAEEGKSPARDLAMDALVDVLSGEVPLIIEAHRHSDIMTALRLADEFDFRLILAGASDAHLLIDEIRAADVPVIIHPTMARARAGGDTQHMAFTTAAELMDAGIEVAMQSGFEGYVPKTRVVLFEAAMTIPYGASFDQALEMVTMAPARILGLSDEVGSLEVGKDGDVALFDGDPFEYTTNVTGTVIEGRRVSEVRR